MKHIFIAVFFFLSCMLFGAMQYNVKGNQGWMTFDSDTELSLELSRSGKDKDNENFIDRGEGIVDYGWYNLDTGDTGSFMNGKTATFTEKDSIGLYVTDKAGNTYLSTKPRSPFEDDIWGKSKLVDGNIIIGGGNLGSNGTHEYYTFTVKTAGINSDKAPNGQPLPGTAAAILIGIVFFLLWQCITKNLYRKT